MGFFKKIKSFIKDKPDSQKEMSFVEHLEELRWTVFRSLLYMIVVAILVFSFKSFVFNKIVFAVLDENFPTYRFLCWLGDRFCVSPPELNISTRKMAEQFMVHFKVAFVLGFVVAFPLIIWEIWKFVAPGLKAEERRYSSSVILTGGLLFFAGVLFSFFVITPFAVRFFAGYTVGDFAATMPTLDSYVGFITMLIVPVGIIFELPLLIYFLSKAGIVTVSFLKKYRRHAIIITLILSGLITPPDVFSQVMIAIPLAFIYEVGIFIAKRIEKKRKT
jgi:sec-independent protein translocase protein TatC